MAFHEVMPSDPVSLEQANSETSAVESYILDPASTVFHALGNITNPVLVIAGTLDQRISIQDAYTLVEHIPEASFWQFADAGHESILQHAITAGRIISAFLDEDTIAE